MKPYPAIILFLLVATARADMILWDGSNDEFWGEGNNWTGGDVPTAEDDVRFDDTAFGFTVNLGSESRTVNSLTLDSEIVYTLENPNDTPLQTLTVGDVTVSSGTGHIFDLPVILAGDATYTIATDADLSLEGVLSGTDTLTKRGAGTLLLSGDNTFAGNTVIHEGAIVLIPDAEDINLSLQNSTVSVNVHNGLQHTTLSEIHIGALAGNGDYHANGSYVEVGGNNASTTYSGNLTDEFLALRKEGTGTWTLAGSDLLISQFQVGDGAVVFDGAGVNMGVFQSAYRPISFQNGTDANVINLSGSNITVDQSSLTVLQITPFTLTDILAISDPAGGTALTVDSDLNRELKSTITDHTSGPGSIQKLGTGALTLKKANTYSGTTTISDGQIILDHALALQNSTVEIGLDDALDLNGHDATLGGLKGNGALALGTSTITVGGNDTSNRYDGDLSGSGGLIKEGTGTWLLGGNNTFTGDTVIHEGVIYLTPDGSDHNYSLQNSTVHLNVDNGLQHDFLNVIAIGALAGSGDYHAVNPLVEVGGNDTSTIYSGNLSGDSVTLIKEGSGTWTLQGSALAIPGLLVGGGAVVFDGAGGGVNTISTVNRPVAFQNDTQLEVGLLDSSDITIDSGAAVTVAGDFSLKNSDTLVRGVGDASTLDVTGTATLSGTIKVLFPEGYTPPVGELLTLCTFGGMGAGIPALDSTALPAGYDYALELVSDGANSSLALVVSFADTVSGFRLQYGLAADGSEDALDDSGNGVANIFYYVFGLGDPAEVDIDRSRLPALSVETGTGNLVLTYVRPVANDTGLMFQVFTSDDLTDWFTPDELGSDYQPTSENTEPLGDDHITVTQIYPIQPDEDRGFYRVAIEYIEDF